jgi:hypothetical protein
LARWPKGAADAHIVVVVVPGQPGRYRVIDGCHQAIKRGDLTLRGIMNLDGVQHPAPAGSRSFESFPGNR